VRWIESPFAIVDDGAENEGRTIGEVSDLVLADDHAVGPPLVEPVGGACGDGAGRKMRSRLRRRSRYRCWAPWQGGGRGPVEAARAISLPGSTRCRATLPRCRTLSPGGVRGPVEAARAISLPGGVAVSVPGGACDPFSCGPGFCDVGIVTLRH
jgi:hypothetical protein